MYDQHISPFGRKKTNWGQNNKTDNWKDHHKNHDNDKERNKERLLPHTLKMNLGNGQHPICYQDNTGYKILASETVTIASGKTELVNTSLQIELIPNKPETKIDIQIDSIQELQDKHLYIVNHPGTIDLDYRGEIKVILWNYSNEPVVVNIGDPIGKLGFYKRVNGNIITFKETAKDIEKDSNKGIYKEEIKGDK